MASQDQWRWNPEQRRRGYYVQRSPAEGEAKVSICAVVVTKCIRSVSTAASLHCGKMGRHTTPPPGLLCAYAGVLPFVCAATSLLQFRTHDHTRHTRDAIRKHVS